MTRVQPAWLGLTLVTAAVYAILLWLGARYLYAGSDRLPPFDARVLGYSAQAAREYLAALGPDQVRIYTGPMHWIDTLFPPLLGGWIWITLRWLGAARAVWLAPLYVLVDWGENALVGRMLEAGAQGVSDGLVAWASAATAVKFAALALALIAAGHAGLRRWGKL